LSRYDDGDDSGKTAAELMPRANAPHYIAFRDAARPVMKEVAEGRLSRETAITLMATIAFGGSAEAAPVEPPERPAERRDRINAELLGELLDLEREGKGRGAVDFLARKRARDPHDPDEVDALKKHLWRLWRRHKRKGALRR
jgi:hypothetical protein